MARLASQFVALPPERRALATAHAAMLSATAGKVALTLPISADAGTRTREDIQAR